MSLPEYLGILVKNAQLNESKLVTAILLLRRVIKKGFTFSHSESFKLMSAVCFVTSKLVEDGSEYWALPDFATISGIDKKLLQNLETTLLVEVLEFDLIIKRKEYLRTRRLLREGDCWKLIETFKFAEHTSTRVQQQKKVIGTTRSHKKFRIISNRKFKYIRPNKEYSSDPIL